MRFAESKEVVAAETVKPIDDIFREAESERKRIKLAAEEWYDFVPNGPLVQK